ncbi:MULTISPECIES: hypothetical protein [Clostridium]|jgi:hypothetical protein|uniref:Uncharacterized protein n=1 Tax=Clostridium lapidicellarium TaxID=3240931 RepID=A0ABV4DU59_9CLOT|nr:hypothetical protein [uncultured Clostridium sp.]NLU08698.1 hypothetical protein [Clostridiales bacterium]
MYDIKNSIELTEKRGRLRADCIGDRGYFNSFQNQSMFELKSIHIPIKNLSK